ncbi:MAG TPA: DHA2 family efflux MFS transporter permease subunit [Acidimicrobiales bacterium]|nr:DHA2 family efflux MFS transporter permease subunit [Acidimicrobiales bacterium]
MTELTGGPETRSAPLATTHRKAIFLVTALGAFMASLDLSIVNVAFPALERAFPHDTRASLSWVLTGYAIIFGALLVVAGRTADRLGSRRVFFFGLGVFSFGSLLCAVAPSVPTLIIGRVVQGFGAASLLPASLSLLLAAYSKEKRSQVVALWGGIGALAVATGPSLGAALITAFSWRAAFYVNLPIGLVAWLVGRRVLARTPGTGSTSSPDFPGVVLLSGALATLVLSISEGPSWGWSSARVITGFVVSVVLTTFFLYRSAHHEEPVLDLQLFKARSFSVANSAVLLYAMGFFAMLLGNILFLTSVWHYSILDAGLAVTPGPLVVATISGPAGKLAGTYGFRRVLLVGFSVFTLGLLWYVLRVGVTPDYPAIWLPGALIVGLGIGLTFPILSAAAVSSLEPARYAVGSAVNQTARQVGGAIGVALLVVILGAPASAVKALRNFQHLWWFCATTAALAGVICTGLSRTKTTPVFLSSVDLDVDEARSGDALLDGELVTDSMIVTKPSPIESD